ncbi:MAG: AAA family ATPase [Phormidesmis sp. CAN_BIN36]|nr:AAA family ATPase [Phormidesmis sp. CAN_BIN36]
MAAQNTTQWREANWQYLLAAIAQVRQAIERHLDSSQQSPASVPLSDALVSPALEQLCTRFHLSPFEREVLLVCAGMELSPEFSLLCGQAQGDPKFNYPTFMLMLSVFPHYHWSALTPEGALRHWRLIELGEEQTLTQRQLRIDERILHYLIGEQSLDDRFAGIIDLVSSKPDLVSSHQQLAKKIAALWQQNEQTIVQLYGIEAVGKSAIASTVAQLTQRNLYRFSTQATPTNPSDINTLVLLWNREAILNDSVLMIDYDSHHEVDRTKAIALESFVTHIQTPLVITGRVRSFSQSTELDRPFISLEVHPPTADEQRLLWQSALTQANIDNRQIEPLVTQFNLNQPTIYSVCAEATHPSQLWNLCRLRSRPQMDDLAQRIEAGAGWEDLVLPDAQKQILKAIAAQIKQRAKVYEQWGFGTKSKRGLGISALFAGASGTGKTMAAEVLAQTLKLDLYRIDLSAVVSKYIGETEKNLGRVFDAAESGSVILLFDEADALFGKRSEVKDSHDRYANMEVSYLLQRIEAYQGLAILTTNLKESLDTAFLRRIRFVIKFPFPDSVQREEIWRRVFPKALPVEALDMAKLARLNVAGGNIRNIALNAAFIAADTGEKVSMKHLLEASKSEYAKLERTLTDAEVRGWIL